MTEKDNKILSRLEKDRKMCEDLLSNQLTKDEQLEIQKRLSSKPISFHPIEIEPLTHKDKFGDRLYTYLRNTFFRVLHLPFRLINLFCKGTEIEVIRRINRLEGQWFKTDRKGFGKHYFLLEAMRTFSPAITLKWLEKKVANLESQKE